MKPPSKESLKPRKSLEQPQPLEESEASKWPKWLFALQKAQISRGLSAIKIADALEKRSIIFLAGVIGGVLELLIAHPLLSKAFPHYPQYLVIAFTYSGMPAGVSAGVIVGRLLHEVIVRPYNERRLRSINKAIETSTITLAKLPDNTPADIRKAAEENLRGLFIIQKGIIDRMQ